MTSSIEWGMVFSAIPLIHSKWFWFSLCVGIPLFVAAFISDE